MGFFDNLSFSSFLPVVGNIIDGAIGINQQNRQNAFNSEEAEKQREWASSEASRSRDWQKFMMDYDSPEYRKNRLLEAGYSPWFSEQNGAGSAVSSPMVSGGSSGSTSLSPVRTRFGDTGLQMSQLALNSANVDKINRESSRLDVETMTEFAKAYKELYSVDKDMALRFARSFDERFSNMGSYFHEQLDTAVSQQNLDFARSSLEFTLRKKFGDKEAATKIEEIEAVISHTFGELGLMSSQADLNRSEISLNEQRAYELGARAAQELAAAGLYSSEAMTNNAVREFVVTSARAKAGLDSISHGEALADYNSRSLVRDWKQTDDSKSRQLWNYKQSPEGNYVNSFINGFTNSSKMSFNFGGSYHRGVNDTRVFNMK